MFLLVVPSDVSPRPLGFVLRSRASSSAVRTAPFHGRQDILLLLRLARPLIARFASVRRRHRHVERAGGRRAHVHACAEHVFSNELTLEWTCPRTLPPGISRPRTQETKPRRLLDGPSHRVLEIPIETCRDRVKRSGCRGGGPCGIRGGSSIQTLRRKLSAASPDPTKREPECPDATRGSRIPSCRPVDPGLGLSFELIETWTVVDRSVDVRFSHVGRVGDVYEAARRAKSEILRRNPKGVEIRANQGKIAGR